MKKFFILLVISVFITPVIHANSVPQVVINEIHYHPDNNTEAVEFIELYNPSAEPIDISGWYFSGITYIFPTDTIIDANGYVLVCENINAFLTKYGIFISISRSESLGPFEGKLSNEGDRIVLYNAEGHQL